MGFNGKTLAVVAVGTILGAIAYDKWIKGKV